MGLRQVACSGASRTSANTTRNQKISGQPAPLSRIQPPMIGAMAGAMPNSIDTWLIRRCASWHGRDRGSPRGRRSCRHPPTRPAARADASSVRSVDSAQPTEAPTNTTRPPRITLRAPRIGQRAMRQLIRPWNSRYADGRCTATSSTDRRCASCGNAGEDGIDRERPNMARPASSRAMRRVEGATAAVMKRPAGPCAARTAGAGPAATGTAPDGSGIRPS